MTLAALELNDQSLLIQADDGTLHAESGFARLTPDGIITGEDAHAVAWREPQHVYNQYWCHLNQAPLAASQRLARHHGDIAFAQLRGLWHSVGAPESLMVAAPGSFSDEQLSLLLGMIEALPASAVAIVDSALAACLPEERETLFVDMHLHQSVLSLCRPQGGELRIVAQEVIPDLGMLQVHNTVARHISHLLIDSFRFDPLHASASEQSIHDRIPAWLTRLRWDDEVADTLASEQGELPFILRRDDIQALVGERLVNLRSFVNRHPGCRLLLAHASGPLAGLAAEFSEADVAGQSAAAEHCLSHHPLILEQAEGVYRITALRLGTSLGPAVENDQQLATHLLSGDRALPLRRPVSIRIGDDGVQLIEGIDADAALTVVLRNRSLEAVHRANGTEAVLPRECRPGEAVVVGGHQLKLIEVQDG
ncbi:MAG: hypothetical protein GWM87_03255 [Xanthomonadales bacterium]|nr:hypothetical protein [Xanthomonadales bacterium]NIX12062.1 hypothetical protein [Xanthomonadales bacterium]